MVGAVGRCRHPDAGAGHAWGQLRPVGKAEAPLDRTWWVLWVDADLRTLVLGTPDGSFGVILNRDARLPADRRTAARDILRWNGYDLSLLRDY